jgi:guanylate kinase
MQTGSGIPFVLSAPSGTGKTTLSHRLVQEMAGLRFSVSHTTRLPRGGEKDGVDYHFVTRPAFQKLVRKRGFLEHAEVFGRFYGTHQDEIERAKEAGTDLLLDIDVQGGVQVKKKRRDAVLIMLLPPSMAELERRLRNRNEDDPNEIAKRLKTARWELTFAPRYHYLVVNDDIDRALAELKSIVCAARARTGMRKGLLAGLKTS